LGAPHQAAVVVRVVADFATASTRSARCLGTIVESAMDGLRLPAGALLNASC